jgi:hypothetical protein
LDYKAVGRVTGEFGLIVIGVMVALAGDSWLETRSQQGLEHEYLERIAVDLERTLQSLGRVTAAMDAIDAHSRAVLPYLRGHASTSEPFPVVASAYQTTRGIFPSIVDDAFVELSLGPGLSIVRDEGLRMDLIGYFRSFDRGNLPEIVISDNIAIRDAVRRVIPAELQIAIREGCVLTAEPLSCDVAVNGVLAEAAYNQLLADANVRESLNLWLQSVNQERRRVSSLEERGADLLAALRGRVGDSAAAS